MACSALAPSIDDASSVAAGIERFGVLVPAMLITAVG
jgi:hypothetical protein